MMDSKIIFVGSRGGPGVGFLRRVVSGGSSAFSVEIFGSGETLTLQAVARGDWWEGPPPAWPKIQPRSGVIERAGIAK